MFNAEGGGQKFLMGCSEPSQRFYHVPRSFLKAKAETTMVLLEEAGGDPSRVDFHTVAVGTACTEAAEVGDEVGLACSHCRTISRASVARTRAGVSPRRRWQHSRRPASARIRARCSTPRTSAPPPGATSACSPCRPSVAAVVATHAIVGVGATGALTFCATSTTRPSALQTFTIKKLARRCHRERRRRHARAGEDAAVDAAPRTS
ncbi:hypothetical protein QYE76_039810 [Lolium multiflorum]|uniref:Uncharacterized protein n=1 Tax=Lolium multiflorum TaxID=4521 RepID=A0AAD8WS47_LOLMU|nr:hypothetical protein QYE76_039810 [Lolium multiflorum]